MNKFIIIIFALIILTISSTFSNDQGKKNDMVDVQIKLKQNELPAGSTGEIEIKFKPKKDIHINFEPPISVKFDSSSLFSKVEKLNVPRKPKEEYLNTSKPVTQKFTLSKNIHPGKQTVKGTLIYFYCSGSDGWCSRFKYPFEVTLKIK
ncbi:MAG: hypothetical protein HY964_00710 [Ignavibacteriales bacterium]|nr:hypothetical protein [Ignavibacteriales bacterium]